MLVAPPSRISIRSRGEVGNDADHVFSFHEAMQEVEEAEERLVESHRSAVQMEREMLGEEDKLLAEMDGTDYDPEGAAGSRRSHGNMQGH